GGTQTRQAGRSSGRSPLPPAGSPPSARSALRSASRERPPPGGGHQFPSPPDPPCGAGAHRRLAPRAPAPLSRLPFRLQDPRGIPKLLECLDDALRRDELWIVGDAGLLLLVGGLGVLHTIEHLDLEADSGLTAAARHAFDVKERGNGRRRPFRRDQPRGVVGKAVKATAITATIHS